MIACSSLFAGFDVIYVAENHENLHHTLVFFTVAGLKAGTVLHAEVLSHFPEGSAYGGVGSGLLVIKSGPQSSLPLLLPAHTAPGPKEVRAQSSHYEIKLMTQTSRSPSPDSDNNVPLLDAAQLATINPVSFLCASCSLPVIQSNRVETWRDLPSEHWEELVEAWMCHGDQKLHDHVQQHSKAGFWPAEGLALVGGSYILFDETAMNTNNLHVAVDSSVSFYFITLQFLFPFFRASRRLALAPSSGWRWGIARPSARLVGALGFAASSVLIGAF